ncbi:hypothetical protein [Lignipirellula cremea]|uniref:hypothetical protein n=1 Tax=Lignipirellula cremea TaxID=2528010 RepID=UPI0011A7AFA3|nr:hypothetical protein [Lignipirellula cremea]
MSIRNEKAYVHWIEEFLRRQRRLAGKWRHPAELGSQEFIACGEWGHLTLVGPGIICTFEGGLQASSRLDAVGNRRGRPLQGTSPIAVSAT